MDDNDQRELEVEETGIPVFKWTNPKTHEEGWVTFNDPDDLTGRDIQSLRKTISGADEGPIANAFMARALELLVAEWDVPMNNGKPSPIIPRLDKTRKVLETVPGKFMIALEKHVRPHLDFIRQNPDGDDDGEPGSPHRPARG